MKTKSFMKFIRKYVFFIFLVKGKPLKSLILGKISINVLAKKKHVLLSKRDLTTRGISFPNFKKDI
jgi:hypothetical protein